MALLLNKINTDNSVIQKLQNLLGVENVLTSIEDRYSYAFDSSATCAKKTHLADIIVLPKTTEQVCEIVKIANQNNIPIVARGAGTNHAGGCVPLKGGIIIHFSKMNKIIEINKENLTCKVQPGVIIEKLQKEVEKTGLFYPPDPSNLKVSTVGGSVGMSSSGPRNYKYGSTKDYVLDLEVVVSDGSVINTGCSTVKNVTGYNLTQLFVGSEGTLGIVTQATFKLIPKPQFQEVFLAYFDSIDAAANVVTEIIAQKISPTTIDLIDKATIETIEKFYPAGLYTKADAALIIEIDGVEEFVKQEIEKVVNICNDFNAAKITLANTIEDIEKIWTSRRSAFGAVTKLSPNVVTEDAVVPRDKIPEIVREIRRICKKYNVKACIMGHAGDGNIHPNFAVDLRDKDESKRLDMAIEEFFDSAIKLGGTLSGEHGIGMTKSKYLRKALDPLVIALMRGIKNVFDPKGIFNPGKIF